jgi:hypothetical protein
LKKSPKKPKGKKDIYCSYIELDSPMDFARQLLDYTSKYIRVVKMDKAYRLFLPGEQLDSVRLVYYTDMDKIANYFVYNPDSDHKEKLEITNATYQNDYQSYRAPIIEMLKTPYTETSDTKKMGSIMKIEIKDPEMLVKSLAANMQNEDTPSKLYSFYAGGEHIIGTFDFLHEKGAKIFTFARTKVKEKFSGMKYDYEKDLIEYVNSFAEKSAIYIRVINLKKQFIFF